MVPIKPFTSSRIQQQTLFPISICSQKWCLSLFLSPLQQHIGCLRQVLGKTSLRRATVLWLNSCLAACALHSMCFRSCWESSHRRTIARKRKHINACACACWPMHALIFCQSLSRAHTPCRPGGWSGLDRDGHMLGSEQQHVIHISLSLALSFCLCLPPNFLLPSFSYCWSLSPSSPSSPSSLCPPVPLKTWVFQMYSAHKLISEPIGPIRYLWLKCGDFCPLSLSPLPPKKSCVFCLNPTLPPFSCLFFM